jgi:hypothetical protein
MVTPATSSRVKEFPDDTAEIDKVPIVPIPGTFAFGQNTKDGIDCRKNFKEIYRAWNFLIY